MHQASCACHPAWNSAAGCTRMLHLECRALHSCRAVATEHAGEGGSGTADGLLPPVLRQCPSSPRVAQNCLKPCSSGGCHCGPPPGRAHMSISEGMRRLGERGPFPKKVLWT